MKQKTQDWLEFVKRDLKGAELLLSNDDLTNLVLFHCQQAVEKVFKAILEEFGLAVPRLHSTIRLYNLLPDEAQKAVSATPEELEDIDDIYIDVRYPGDLTGILSSGLPSKSRAEDMFQIASRIVKDGLAYLDGSPDKNAP